MMNVVVALRGCEYNQTKMRLHSQRKNVINNLKIDYTAWIIGRSVKWGAGKAASLTDLSHGALVNV